MAPPCPHCGSDNTQYGEYGVMCLTDGILEDECPIVFFKEQ